MNAVAKGNSIVKRPYYYLDKNAVNTKRFDTTVNRGRVSDDNPHTPRTKTQLVEGHIDLRMLLVMVILLPVILLGAVSPLAAQTNVDVVKLTASTPNVSVGHHFGWSVALDGDTALIGAYLDDDVGQANSGSVYVFTRSGTGWIQEATLTANDSAANDNFGNSVAIFGDTALVGAYLDDDVGSDSGSVYVFTRSGTNWSQQDKLTAGDGMNGDKFGKSLAFDGHTALVGAFLDDGTDQADSGSAYVFTRSGSSWIQQAKLTAQ